MRSGSAPEHGQPAFRLFFRRFILNDVPMLAKNSILKAHNICGNPVHQSRLLEGGEVVALL